MTSNMIRLLTGLLFCAVVIQAAGVPGIITYQGRLTDAAGQPVADGPYQIKFKIYAAAIGIDSLWSSGFQSVSVTSGGFSYQLGSSNPFPVGLFSADPVRYLGVTVGSDAEMVPRIRLGSAPYAFQSLWADSAKTAVAVVDGAITDADISMSAGIAPSKIAGTAATLTSSQVFSGSNRFMADVNMFDSVFRSSSYGVRIGTAVAPIPEHLFEVNRHYNTTNFREGVTVSLENASTGSLYGLYSEVKHADAGNGGTAYGLWGDATSDGSSRTGVYGQSQCLTSSATVGASFGVRGTAFDGSTAYGVYGYASSATTNYAGYFSGNAHVTGTLSKGGGSFRIDHPLDPENKYLQHSFVESPDMKNVYDGVVTLDGKGEATVRLPDYFEALNRDFRYQLTPLGAPGPNLFIAEEISNNCFRIAGGNPGARVSWQVSGIRKDAFANMNRIQVEVEKRPEERGKYLHPEAFGRDQSQSIDWKIDRRAEEARASRSAAKAR